MLISCLLHSLFFKLSSIVLLLSEMSRWEPQGDFFFVESSYRELYIGSRSLEIRVFFCFAQLVYHKTDVEGIAVTRHHSMDACLCKGTQVLSRGTECIQVRVHLEDEVLAIARLRQNDNVMSDGRRRRRGGKRGSGAPVKSRFKEGWMSCSLDHRPHESKGLI